MMTDSVSRSGPPSFAGTARQNFTTPSLASLRVRRGSASAPVVRKARP
jgi:hypothetical protein